MPQLGPLTISDLDTSLADVNAVMVSTRATDGPPSPDDLSHREGYACVVFGISACCGFSQTRLFTR